MEAPSSKRIKSVVTVKPEEENKLWSTLKYTIYCKLIKINKNNYKLKINN